MIVCEKFVKPLEKFLGKGNESPRRPEDHEGEEFEEISRQVIGGAFEM